MNYRKYIILCILFAVASVFLLSYKKKEMDIDGYANRDGLVCLKGDPVGIAVQKKVGTEGDSIVSEDGRMQLIIPAGAISGDVSIKIESIENTNPAGIGMSYRISPKLTFKKPVTVRFSNGEADSLDFSSCNVGLSFQDSAGEWKMKAIRILDESGKTISSETSKSGDWCVMEPIRLIPVENYIKPGEKVNLVVLGYIPLRGQGLQDPCDIWKNPDFRHADIPINAGANILPRYISRWELWAMGDGVGKLTASGTQGIYQASMAAKPVMNPATVAVYIKGFSRPLLAWIHVETEKEFIIINMRNKTYRYADVDVNADDNIKADKIGLGKFGITWRVALGAEHIGYITWSGKATGNHSWDDAGNQFWFEPETFDGAFVNSYAGDLNQRPSNGSVTIEKFGKIGEFVTGSFIVTNAGHREPDDIYKGTHNITGRFRIIRTK